MCQAWTQQVEGQRYRIPNPFKDTTSMMATQLQVYERLCNKIKEKYGLE